MIIKYDLNRIDVKNLNSTLLLYLWSISYNITDILSNKTKSLIEGVDKNEVDDFRLYDQGKHNEMSVYWINQLKEYNPNPIVYVEQAVKILITLEDDFYKAVNDYDKSTSLNECKLFIDKIQEFKTLMTLMGNKICEQLIINYYGIDIVKQNLPYYGIISDLGLFVCRIHIILEEYNIENNKAYYYKCKGYLDGVFMILSSTFYELDIPAVIDIYHKIGLLTSDDIDFIMKEYNKDDNKYKSINSEHIM